MMQPATYLCIGRLHKPTGTQGHLLCDFDDDLDFESLRHVYLRQEGCHIPFFITAYDDRHGLSIKLEEVDTPEQASKLVNKSIYITPDQVTNAQDLMIGKHMDFQNFIVYNQGNELGKVIDIEVYPSQLMAKIQFGEREILIPLIEDWIEKIDMEGKKIEMQLPEGLELL